MFCKSFLFSFFLYKSLNNLWFHIAINPIGRIKCIKEVEIARDGPRWGTNLKNNTRWRSKLNTDPLDTFWFSKPSTGVFQLLFVNSCRRCTRIYVIEPYFEIYRLRIISVQFWGTPPLSVIVKKKLNGNTRKFILCVQWAANTCWMLSNIYDRS